MPTLVQFYDDFEFGLVGTESTSIFYQELPIDDR